MALPKPTVLIQRPARPCQNCGQYLDKHQPRTKLCPPPLIVSAVAVLPPGSGGPGGDPEPTRFTVVPYGEPALLPGPSSVP